MSETGNSSESPNTALAIRLASNISARRRELGLTQAQLAERLGVETETLSRFERGKHVPSLLTLERLAELLKTNVSSLLAEESITADDDAVVMSAWLSQLPEQDRLFAQKLLKLCCDYLAVRQS